MIRHKDIKVCTFCKSELTEIKGIQTVGKRCENRQCSLGFPLEYRFVITYNKDEESLNTICYHFMVQENKCVMVINYKQNKTVIYLDDSMLKNTIEVDGAFEIKDPYDIENIENKFHTLLLFS